MPLFGGYEDAKTGTKASEKGTKGPTYVPENIPDPFPRLDELMARGGAYAELYGIQAAAYR
jgi:hypothetical protein